MSDSIPLACPLSTPLGTTAIEFLRHGSFDVAFEQLHDHLRQIAQSPLCAIGEILYDEDGRPFVRCRDASGSDLHDAESLVGAVALSGTPVQVNDPDRDPRRSGLPPGWPPLTAFLGLPIYRGDELIGVAVVANRPGGYDDALIERLQPFLAACAGFLVAYRNDLLRRGAETRLRSLTEELRQSNRSLQDFASVASHDLQEPLRKIQAFGGRLKAREGERLSPEGADYLERMLGAAGRMQTLVEDLLAYSRVTTRGQEFVPVDLNDTLAGVLSDLEERLRTSGGTVTAQRLPTVDADPVQMRQLFQNLIGNGLKFRRPDIAPQVQVTAQRLEDGPAALWRLTVVDNGIGFEPRHAERIFDLFERLHGRDQYPGTGIGLAICKAIALRHGGSIRATSMPGQGALFAVELPDRCGGRGR